MTNLFPMKAFCRAIKRNDLEEVRRLLPTINVNDTYKEYSFLIKAINKIEIFKFLLEQGYDPNWRDHNQCSVLHHAVWGNYIETTAILLKSGAEINAQDCHGSTVLHYAMLNGTEPMIELLLGYGVDINILNNKQRDAKAEAGDAIAEKVRCNIGRGGTIQQMLKNIAYLEQSLETPIKGALDDKY